MSFSLKNRKILITGSTDGLGLATAKRLAKENAHLILHGRTKESVEKAVEEVKKAGAVQTDRLICDLRDERKVSEIFSTIDSLDILINNAGVWLEGSTVDATEDKIIELTKVNMLAPLIITKTLLPKLLQSEFGQILNVVSIAGVEIPAGYYHTIYTATKFAMQGFSEGLAKEFYGKNLRVMGYYPGGMNTNIFKKAGNTYKSSEAWMFDVGESSDAICFMLSRDKSINVKRMDLIKQ